MADLKNLLKTWRDNAHTLRREVERGVALRQSAESKLSRAQVLETVADQLDRALTSDPWLPIEECGELEEGEIYLVGWRGHDPHEARVWTWTDGIWEDEEGYEQQPPDYIHQMGPIRGPEEKT